MINLKSLNLFVPYEHFRMDISKICSISMGWKTLRDPLPLLGPGSCTTNIHKIVGSASSSIEKVEYADHNLCRRHVNNRSNQKGGGVNQGHSHLHFGTFTFFSQFKEICASTMSGNRISGPSVNLKVQKVQEECTKMYNKNWTLILELTKLLGLLLSTISKQLYQLSYKFGIFNSYRYSL